MAYISLILAQAQEERYMGCSDGMGVDAHDMPVGRSHGHESSFAVLTSQASPEWYVEIHDVNGQGNTHVKIAPLAPGHGYRILQSTHARI